MAKRGETWSDEETLTLICRWGEAKIQKKMDNCHKATPVYKEISEELAIDGYVRDYGQCRTKIKHLKSEYKKYKDALRRSGAKRTKEPWFFKKLDTFLGDKVEAVGLNNGIDTMAAKEAGTGSTSNVSTLESSSSIILPVDNQPTDGLVEKYRKGDKEKRDCPQCGFSVEIETAGVHISENGCIKVYCDEGPFSCPNCPYTERESDTDHEDRSGDEHAQTEAVRAQMVTPTLESSKKNSKKRKSVEGRDAPSKGKDTKSKKKKTASEQIGEAVNSFMEFQKKSEESHMKFMKDQAAAEETSRKEEMKMHYELMGFLVKAAQPTSSLGNTYPGTSHLGYTCNTIPTVDLLHTDDFLENSNEKTYFQL